MIRKRYILIILFGILSSLPMLAQSEKVQNLPYIDQRRLHFGFMLGVHTQDLSFEHSGANTSDGHWYAEIPSFSPGFAVGLVADYAFLENLNLRFTPSMYFGSKYVKMKNSDTNERMSQDIKSNYVTFPLSIKYSARRAANYRPYMMAGVSGMYDLSKRKESALQIKRFDMALEFGFGCDFYLPYFKLIPELKFCIGLTDVLEHNRSDLQDKTMLKYTEALSSARSRMVVLSFYFE